MSSRRMMFALLLLALVLRLGNMAFTSQSPLFHYPTTDEWEHYSLSSALAAGDWLGREAGVYHRPTLFAYVSALLFAIFGTHFMVTHVFILTMDCLAVVAWFGVARRCFPRPAAFLGCLGLVVYYPLVHIAGTGYMESFVMWLNALFLLFLAEHVRRVRRTHGKLSPWPPLLIAGVLGGLGILGRPTLILLMPFFGIVLLLVQWRLGKGAWPGRLIQPVVFAAVVTLVVSPLAIRHQLMYNVWAPLGTGSALNFHMGNNRDGWGWKISSPGIEYSIYTQFPVIEGGVEPDVEKVNEWWSERNNAYVREEPLVFARGVALKFLQAMNAKEIAKIQNFQHYQELSPIERYAPGLGLFGPLGLLGFVAAGFFRRRFPPAHRTLDWMRIVLFGWIVIYLFGAALYHPISRHRLPALPPLVLFSGFGGIVLWQLLKVKSKTLFVAVSVLLAGVVITRLPVVPDWMFVHERWWTQVSLGVAERNLGRGEQAIAEFRKGIEIYPDKLETWRQLAMTHGQMGQLEQAVEAQGRLLQLIREQYPAYYMVEAEELERLLRYQIAAGDVQGGEASARSMMELVPESPAPLFHLGRELLFQGFLPDAVRITDELRERYPSFEPGEALKKRIEEKMKEEASSGSENL